MEFNKTTRTFAIANTIMGGFWLILFLMVGLKSGAVSILIQFLFLVLHAGAGIGVITKQSWAKLAATILGWFGLVIWGLSLLAGLAMSGRISYLFARIPFLAGAAGAGFIIGLSFLVIFILPFIMYYLAQLMALKDN